MRAVVQRVLQANVSVRKSILLAAGEESQGVPLRALEDGGVSGNVPAKQEEEGVEGEKSVIPVASTQIVQEVVGEIGNGLLILLGVGREDSESDVSYLADRTVNLRIFPDYDGQMNLSLLDVGGEVLVVSQFTLYGDARKGRRPSFFEAMDPTAANGLYMSFCEQLRKNGVHVATGRFGEHMHVSLINDGPVTLLLDSKKTF